MGIAVAAPVGPISILCINRTLKQGVFVGLSTGLGAALVGMIYGGVAGFGLVTVSTQLLQYQNVIRIGGGCFLLYLAIKSLFTKLQIKNKDIVALSLFKDFSSAFLLTFTNPATIISFAAIYAGLGLAEHSVNYLAGTLLISGVFIGSLLWWIYLSILIAAIQYKLDSRRKKAFRSYQQVFIGIWFDCYKWPQFLY